ncbi:MAG: hypothetical protein AAGM22_02525 [Acidobacteriota bacterium]
MKKMTLKPWILAALAIALLATVGASTAVASDGVTEINMAAAAVGNITPGDAPGLPVTISVEGSYILTGNLSTTSTAVDVIEVTASYVTIDMNGFTIVGPGTGTGNGIFAASVSTSDIEVRNGTVREMGSAGVRLAGFRGRVINVRVIRNGDRGIQLGGTSLVKNCLARDNDNQGISASTGSNVIENISNFNGASPGNLGGIFAGNNSYVYGNVSNSNFGEGIVTGSGATIVNNSTSENTEHGIRAGAGALLQGNAARNNDLFGLSLATNSAYVGNVMTGNNSGSVSNGVQIGTNFCGANTVCP